MPPRCYLIHFDEQFGTPRPGTVNRHKVGAQHYLGFVHDGDVARRFAEHVGNSTVRGSRLVAAVVAAGVRIEVVRTWVGSWPTEKALKRRRNAAQLCPICNPARRRNRTRRWRMSWPPYPDGRVDAAHCAASNLGADADARTEA